MSVLAALLLAASLCTDEWSTLAVVLVFSLSTGLCSVEGIADWWDARRADHT